MSLSVCRHSNANLPIENLVADDQTGGGANGLCEEVGGRRGGHSGEMAGELGEAREHPESKSGRVGERESGTREGRWFCPVLPPRLPPPLPLVFSPYWQSTIFTL